MSQRQQVEVTKAEDGSPHVDRPDPIAMQELYGNGFAINQMEDMDSPYSDFAGPSPYEREQRRAILEGQQAFKDMTPEEQQAAVSKSGPGHGYAATRIGRHYGGMNEVPSNKDEHQVLDLDSEEGRLGTLATMRQNANPLDPDGMMRCGASSLVGGAVYGGGKQGLTTLLDSIAADRKKQGLPPLAGEDLAAVQKKLSDPAAKLTQGDLDVIQSQTYDHFRAGKDGVDGRKLGKFIQDSPGMKSMFAAKDMGLDGIDLTGDGRSEHLVLGIGRDFSGNRKMVYDPQARQKKEGWGDYMDHDKAEGLRSAEKTKRQAEYDDLNRRYDEDSDSFDWWGAAEPDTSYYGKGIDKLDAEVDAAARAKQYAYSHDSQLVVDPNELKDYARATDYRAGAKGVEEHDAQTKAAYDRRGW